MVSWEVLTITNRASDFECVRYNNAFEFFDNKSWKFENMQVVEASHSEISNDFKYKLHHYYFTMKIIVKRHILRLYPGLGLTNARNISVEKSRRKNKSFIQVKNLKRYSYFFSDDIKFIFCSALHLWETFA